MAGNTSITTSTAPVNTQSYGPTNPYFSGVFITQEDRSISQNNNLRGNTTDTDLARQGPCASGYHIPTSEEWDRLLRTWAKENSLGIGTGTSTNEPPFRTVVDGTTAVANFENYFKVPLVGYLHYDDGRLERRATE
jgi:hypothetical protein